MDEYRCEECESIFTVEFVDGLSDGVVKHCPFCGAEMEAESED